MRRGGGFHGRRSNFALLPGVLDLLSVSSAAAYGLRRLRRGSILACRTRRWSDNAEMDIGLLSNGSLDTGSLLGFCGSGSGYVTTWYDQSGNGRHATQTTATSQPAIVNAGTLITLGGKPAINGNRLQYPSGTAAFPITHNAVGAATSSSNDNIIISTSFTGSGNGIATKFDNFALRTTTYGVADLPSSAVTSGVAVVATTTVSNAGAYNEFKNGASFATGSTTVNAGAGAGLVATGTLLVAEAVQFLSSLTTADRQTLERSQGSYFGVSVA